MKFASSIERSTPSSRDAACALGVGTSAPLGASVIVDGVNFGVFSKHATAVDLLLFDHVDDAKPARIISLDAVTPRTYHYWHVFVPGLRPGQIYGFAAHGPFDPSMGLRFDSRKVLLDPYGRAVVVPSGYNRAAACGKGDSAASAMKSVVVDPEAYDWEGDRPLLRPAFETIVA